VRRIGNLGVGVSINVHILEVLNSELINNFGALRDSFHVMGDWISYFHTHTDTFHLSWDWISYFHTHIQIRSTWALIRSSSLSTSRFVPSEVGTDPCSFK